MGSNKQYTGNQIKKAKYIIIEEIYNGISLRQILLKNKDLPNRMMVYEWLNPNGKRYDAEFADNYARAKENQADIDADKLEDLAKEIREEKISPQAARVISDNLRWISGKKRPKKYGDKIDITTDGEKIKDSPISIQIDGKDIKLE